MIVDISIVILWVVTCLCRINCTNNINGSSICDGLVGIENKVLALVLVEAAC